MKKYTITVSCKCLSDITADFKVKKDFAPPTVSVTCKNCGSDLEVDAKHTTSKKELLTRVRLIKHTQKLLDMELERRKCLQQ